MGKVAVILAVGALLAGALEYRRRVIEERKKHPIRLGAIFSSERGKSGKPLPVKFALRNLGPDPVRVITRQGVIGGASFEVHAQDSGGEWWWRKRNVFLNGGVTPPDIIRLGPGESAELRDPTFENWIFPVGRFRLLASYQWDADPEARSLMPERWSLKLARELEFEVDP